MTLKERFKKSAFPSIDIFFKLLFGVLVLFTSCKGQKAAEVTNESGSNSQREVVSTLDERATVIFQDSQGRHWFGGGEGGVYQYDGQQLLRFKQSDGLCSHNIIGIQEDKSGNIYFDTPAGVSQYDGQSFTTLVVADSTDWQLESDDLWFRMGWDKNGPFRYDGQALHYLEFPKSQRADTFYAQYPNAPYTPYGIYSMYYDREGAIWFGTVSLGVCRFDGQAVSWLYEEQLTTIPGGGDFGIRSMVEDQEGYFWFCNSRYRYDILPGNSAGPDINYRKKAGAGSSNDQGETDYPYALSMTLDDEGDIWMATYDEGVWRNDGEQLVHYPIEDGDTEVLLFSIYKDQQGVLWLGTQNAGAYRFDGKVFQKFVP